MIKRKLPIGIQTFREMREEGYYYVDKTGYIQQMVERGKYYFLSRPRRFGKSLLLSTLKELFEGRKALFAGLSIHDQWDWSVTYPVVRISFGGGNFEEEGFLRTNVMEQLSDIEQQAGVSSTHTTESGRLAGLLKGLNNRTGRRVVVLIDEYDKPILDALESPGLAKAHRKFLRGFYAVIKDCDECIKFTFITGVSKFSKASLYSGLNNLNDITLDPRYSGICGYTEADLDCIFAPELEGLDRERIRDWYNGYNWRGTNRVYNPFDVLLLFENQEFQAYWFETGSPSFLVDTLLNRNVTSYSLEQMHATDALLSAFDIKAIGTEALLFQTGYLTILEEKSTGGRNLFRLGYPNREVRESFNSALLQVMGVNQFQEIAHGGQLRELLAANDFAGLETLIRALLSGIPYEWHTRNEIARYEGYYASIMYSWFSAIGLDTVVEDSTSHGRLDLAVRFNANIYLFEFKMVEQPGEGGAMTQIKEKRYANKYRHLNQPIHLIAIEFSRQVRNIVTFEVESV